MKHSIGKKLVLSFLGVALLGLIGGAFGYYGVSIGESAIQEIGSVRLPSVENLLVIAREAANIRGSLLTLSVPGISEEARKLQYVNIDEAQRRYQVAWGIYTTLPHTEEETDLWKKFVPAWDFWQQANKDYLELNRKIDSNGIVDSEHLGRQLEQFTKDHYVLAIRVIEMLFAGGPVFSGGEDPSSCNAGQWMATYQTTNDNLLVNMASIRSKHAQFHEYIHKIKQLTTSGKLEEARALYKNDMAPLMQNIFAYFKTMNYVANDSIVLMKQGKEMLDVSKERQGVALSLLENIVHLNRQKAEEASQHAIAQIAHAKMLTFGAVVAGLVFSIIFGVLSSRKIARPLERVASHLQIMSQGDFSVEVNEKDCRRSDEIGILAQAAETLTGSMCAIVGKIHNGIGSLTASSSDLAAISAQMKSSVVDMSGRTMSAAAAAEKSSDNSHLVADGMQQATAHLSSVASSTEQMSFRISEIAGNAEQVRTISDEASQQADAVTTMMKDLGDAAQKIGKVTETITAISEQINLLALNATIEAAHAGDAGSGFAVVAGEIKELARQTSGATKDIRGRIDAIQSSTQAAIGDIDRIAVVIKTVNEIVPQMAAAIEEQSVVTQVAAANIAEVTSGIMANNEQVMQTALVSKNIASDIATISKTVDGIQIESNQVQQSASEMLILAGQMKAMVVDFKMCKEQKEKKKVVPDAEKKTAYQGSNIMGGFEAAGSFA